MLMFQIMMIPIIIKLNTMTSAMRVSKSPSGFSKLYSGLLGIPIHLTFHFSFLPFFSFDSLYNIIIINNLVLKVNTQQI